MGPCISKKQNFFTNNSISLSEIDDSLAVKSRLISLLLRVGSLIYRFQRKLSFAIHNRELKVSFELKMIELMLKDKLNTLQEAIRQLKQLSAKSKKVFCQEKLEEIEIKIKITEKWLENFESTEKLTKDDEEVVMGLQSYENIRKIIEDAQKDSKFLIHLNSMKQ